MCACAVRAEKAGVDVIQIHGDRLVGALCSTKMNHRTDKFGGSLENRTRFALLLVEALRKAVPDMIIDYKFSVVTPERGKGGIDEADAPEFAKMLEAAGVDMLHVAQANHTGNMADTIPPMGVQPYGFFADISGKVKKRFRFRSAQSDGSFLRQWQSRSLHQEKRIWSESDVGFWQIRTGRTKRRQEKAVTSANVFPVTRDVPIKSSTVNFCPVS